MIATQNPVEHEGTYPLPEAQLDRFMMRLSVGYPEPAVEAEILASHSAGQPLEDIRPVCDALGVAELIHAGARGARRPADPLATSSNSSRRPGATPTSTSAPARAPRSCCCAPRGRTRRRSERDFVIPDDVKVLAPHVSGTA